MYLILENIYRLFQYNRYYEERIEKNMKRVMLIISYDGTAYHGWQIQPHEVTVELKINQALSELCQEEIKVIGASRTDAGVHALGSVAVFDTNSRIPAEKFAYALNARLPWDIRVQSSRLVPSDFHPRHCDCIKTYEYHILNRKIGIPSMRLYSYHFHWKIDLEAMKKGASYLVGEHDFKSFCSAKTQVTDTVRTIYSIDLRQEGEEIILKIRGNGFLYNMVRIITGTLLQVGTGYYKPEQIADMLESKNRMAAGACAPAMGLFLVGIEYPNLPAESVCIQALEQNIEMK